MKNMRNYLRYDKSLDNKTAIKLVIPRKIVFVPSKSFSTDFDYIENIRKKKLNYASINCLVANQCK